MPISSSLKSPVLGLAALALFTTGCATMSTTATSLEPAVSGASMTGHVLGGNQPITAADVRLYSVGTSGYGSAGTLYATTTSDGNGNFSFTQTAGVGSSQSGTKVYSCPTSGNPQMYIVARGGNTQGTGNGANSAAAFTVAIGPCSGIATSFVFMTETTTVATMAALQQYFAPGNATTSGLNQFGYPNTTQAAAGFANAVGLIGNLANLNTATVAATTVSATPVGSTTAATVTVTPEINKINTLANIIAACVNTTSNASTNCTSLFTNATPPNSALTSQPALTYNTATDTLQALYYMLTNPTSGSTTALTNLYNLQAAAGAPFAPTESAAPTDWTVGLNYSSTSACSAGANFLSYVYHIAIDASGNAWAVSNATGGNLYELAPTGTPLTCTLGTTMASKSNTVAIDTNSHVWVGGTANLNIYEVSATSPTTVTAWPTGEPTAEVGVQNLVVDAAGNVNFTPYTGAASSPLFQFSGAVTASSPVTAVSISTTLGADPYYLAADTKNRIYSTETNSTTSVNLFYDVYPSTASGNSNGYLTANVGTSSSAFDSQGVASGLAGTVIALNGNSSTATAANSVSIYTPSATAGTATVTTTAAYTGGIASGREVAVDGAGNIWAVSLNPTKGSYVNGSTTSTLYMFNELTSTGVAISPSGTGTTATTVNGGFQKDATVLPGAPRGVAIDPSGNVWTGGTTGGTSVALLVGAAVPVVTPIVAGVIAGATSTNAVQKP